jgi:hypothetical protein
MKIIIAFVIAALFFLILKVARLGLKRLFNLYYIDNVIIAAELIIWIIYTFWAIDFLFRGKFFYPYLVYAIIIIIAGFVAWFLLKDIFAGIIFRTKHNLKTGSYIKAGDITGQIKSQQLTFLKIITGNGQILRVPYSGIIHEVITELSYPGALEEHTLNLRVDLPAGRTNAAESLVREVILNTPWSNLKEEPTIRFLQENENGYFFEITLLSINRKQIKYIEMGLEEIPLIHVIS